MTDKEIRDVVTPYEFGVSDDIIGTRLARPFRRGWALLLDLVLVSLLTHLPAILLASVGVIFFWRAGKTKNTSSKFGWLRKLMKGIAACLLFGMLIALIDGINEPDYPVGGDDTYNIEGGQALKFGILVLSMPSDIEELEEDIAQKRCDAYACWQDYLTDIIDDIDDVRLPAGASAEFTRNFLPAMQRTLSAEQQQTLLDFFNHSVQAIEAVSTEQTPASSETVSKVTIPVNENGTPSLIAWVRGILEDLGIGFGWAAFYFTALTCWMKGQTPGKWLFGLKIIKLDGTSMTMWESFGRYGGYGAGLATGLLGFIQIFWEPNRQAIHDKISETLVIRLDMNKIDVQEINLYRRGVNKSDEER